MGYKREVHHTLISSNSRSCLYCKLCQRAPVPQTAHPRQGQVYRWGFPKYAKLLEPNLVKGYFPHSKLSQYWLIGQAELFLFWVTCQL